MEYEEGGVIRNAGNSKENKTGDWRNQKPVINLKKCTRCGTCWIYCPENAVYRTDKGAYEIDYDYCKGCGICSKECPFKSIELIGEDK